MGINRRPAGHDLEVGRLGNDLLSGGAAQCAFRPAGSRGAGRGKPGAEVPADYMAADLANYSFLIRGAVSLGTSGL